MNTRITPEQKVTFARYIQNDKEVLDAIMEDMKINLFDQFISADSNKREVIGDILNASKLFEAELNSILLNSITDINK